jgi:hypothetical protein
MPSSSATRRAAVRVAERLTAEACTHGAGAVAAESISALRQLTFTRWKVTGGVSRILQRRAAEAPPDDRSS